jgi:peptide chain release factor 2
MKTAPSAVFCYNPLMESNSELDAQIAELESQMNAVDFWNDKEKAQETIKKIKELKDKRDGVSSLDKGHAVMTILAGAGGDDSEDFARMLFEMYDAYFKRQNYSYSVLHDNKNDHGGFRNVTIEIEGKNVYGNLKNESGVHRLVRISPFNAQAKRHTSFAMVEVLPVIPAVEQKAIPPDELRIETSKSSGPGGQNVNKRETAVRIVHIPTNIAVHVATEREQERNKQKALEILSAKLYKLEEEKQRAEQEGRQISRTTEIEWGNQIRSYVLHPYKMVKDHRTDVETSNVEAVLEKGEIDDFIDAEKKL